MIGIQRGLVSGLVAALLLLTVGVGNGHAARGATGVTAASFQEQEAVAEPTLLPVVLPDLTRVHTSVQGQIQEAFAALAATAMAAEERSEAYGHLAKLLMASEYPDQAEVCLLNAQRLAPDDFRWPYYLGHVQRSKGQLTNAIEHFEHTLQLRPDDVAAFVWLSHTYIDLGQPEAAEPLLTRARSLHPDTQAVLFQLGRAALARHDYATAVEHLEGALRMNPAATNVRYPLAMAFQGLGDLEKAQSYLDQSQGRAGGAGVALADPLMSEVSTVLRSPQAYWDLGLYAGGRGNWPEAVRQFRNAVELAPDSAVLRLNLAVALNHLGEARAAMDQFEEAVRLDPKLGGAHFTMGTLFERSGRDEEAIDRYTLAVTYGPDSAEAHLRLADALRRTDRLEASRSSYQRVLELEPNWGVARFGEAMALVRLTRHPEAVERLRVAMDRHPEEPEFPHALARLLAAAPDPQVRDGQAALDLVRALAERHESPAVAETMAMALAERGQFAEAAEWQRLAMTSAAEAGETEVAQQMVASLALYQRHQPCRTPWRDDDRALRPGPTVEPGLLDPPPPF
jgi:tetratricopeptide (TPR) repeat protein